MCGIVGIWNKRNEDASSAIIERMLSPILHRGPDDGGVWTKGRVGLGHRRLSIIDLSPLGHQPIFTPDHQGVLVYNGEIYNFPLLRKQLESEGCTFSGSSDSEVLLNALHQWGPERTIPLLNGMFAFAYYDLRSDSLWLSRDRLGIKPLFLTETAGQLLFASEIKALLVHPDVEKKIDAAALGRSFVIKRRSHDSLFSGIFGLPQGSWWKLSSKGIEKHQFFDIESALDVDLLESNHRTTDLSTASSALESLLRDSVRMHLASDAPIAAMCSGGVDSSLIAAYASEETSGMVGYVADAPVGGGEAAQALRVRRHLNIPIRQVPVSQEKYLRLWPVSIHHLDGSSHHPSEPALLAVAEACHTDGVKALLTGKGADELFGGYSWHASIYRRWRRWERLLRVAPFLREGRAGYRRLAFPLNRTFFNNETFQSRFRTALVAGAERELLPRRLFEKLAGINSISDRMMTIAGLSDLVGHLSWILHRHDHMSMAASVEMRVPFLENNLIHFGMHLPRSAKLNQGQGKWVLKNIASRRLPRDIVFAKKKGIPHARCLHGGD